MESYEHLLDKAYAKVRVIEKGPDRFEIPGAVGEVSGNTTLIINITAISNYLRRPVDQVSKFLQKELAVAGRLEGNRLVLKTRVNSTLVNEKIRKYAKEFLICPVCNKPDTELVAGKGIKYKHCLACGAQSPVKYHL